MYDYVYNVFRVSGDDTFPDRVTEKICCITTAAIVGLETEALFLYFFMVCAFESSIDPGTLFQYIYIRRDKDYLVVGPSCTYDLNPYTDMATSLYQDSRLVGIIQR